MANQLVVDLTNAINSASVINGANLGAQNLQHRTHVHYMQPAGTNVVAATNIVYMSYKASQVLGGYVTPVTIPAAGTSVTVDVQQYIVGTGWSSVLTGTTSVTSASTALAPIALSFSGTPALVAAPAGSGSACLLEVIVTVSGGGTQVQGLSVDIFITENGQ